MSDDTDGIDEPDEELDAEIIETARKHPSAGDGSEAEGLEQEGNTEGDEHAADGGGFFGEFFDHLRILLDFIHQCVQSGQAQAYHALALFNRFTRAAAGIGGLAGVARHLLDGRLQFAE